MRKKFLSLLLIFTILVGGMPSFGSVAMAKESGSAKLNNLILDKVSVLIQRDHPDVQEFSPDITDYTGTAYYSVNQVNVFPFKKDPNATVTVNGTAVTGDSVNVPLNIGENIITVAVTNGENSQTYTVNIEKVGTDYRGRRPLANDEFTVSTDFGGDVSAMVDGNGSTYWSPDITPVDEEEGTPTSFVIDLQKVRPVSRISMDYAQNYALWSNMVRISISDDGESWTPVVEQGNMREDQGVVRYEFGISYDARYIKYEVIKFDSDSLRINEFTIFEDPENHLVEQDPPEGGDQPFVPTNENIARGQEIVIEKGFPVSGWMPSGQYGRGVPTPEESEILGWDGPLFYDPPLENVQYMKYNPNSLWGLAKAPWGSNGMAGAGEPRDFVDEGMLPYINNAVSFCFGDEGSYSYEEALRFKEWFAFSKERYPGTIVHSNQTGYQWSRANYEEYIRIAEPDLLSWDSYPSWNDSNAWNATYIMLNTPTWTMLRELALKGVDGSGQKPILYGQYLDVYNLDQPMSHKNLLVNLSLLTGMKWLNYFRLEFQFDHCYLWDEDGTPSRGAYEWGEVNRYLKTIDDYILRLNSDWVVSKPGKHLSGDQELSNNVKSAWKMGGFDQNADVNAGYYIQDVFAQNISSANNGLPGDVLLGYFTALPGLSESEVEETFGSSAPKAFMLLNGLSAGSSGSYSNPNVAAKERGSAENTKQTITLTFTGEQTAPLKKVNRDTGLVEDVEIIDNTLTVTLGGGEAELYFWAEDSSCSATSETEGHEASFAFDGYSDTYWQASEDADLPIELSSEFTPKTIDKIIINEQGNAITSYRLQYLVDGEWQDIPGGTGDSIGLSKVVTFDPISVSGIKLIITSANGQVGIKDIRSYASTEATYTITATAGSNGNVTPETLTVAEHEDAVFTVTPEEGYAVDSVTVNGSAADLQGDQLILYNVTENKNINASFIIERPEVINKETLKILIDGVLELKRFDYTGGTWREIQIALPKAQEVLAQEDATDEQIETVYNNLWNAYLALSHLEEGRPIPEEDPPRKVFIDNTDPLINYGGSWGGNGSGSGADDAYLQSQQWVSSTSDSTISMDFTGTGIQIIHSIHPSGGTLSVEIRDQNGDVVSAQDNINFRGNKAMRQVIYEKLDLPYGSYTIKVSYQNNAYAEFDGFFVYNDEGQETNYTVTFDKTPANAQVVVKNAQGDVVDPQADGSYLLAAGNYTYSAAAEGYTAVKDVAFTVSGNMEISVVLEEETVTPNLYTITFKLSPSYALVTVKDGQGNIIEAQEDGSYLLAAGEYTYSVAASDHIAKNNVALTVSQNEELEVVLVNIKYLSITVEYAEQQLTEGLVDSIKQQFEAALKNAKELLANPNATQEEVDAADEELIYWLQYLEFKGDPTALIALIKEAEAIDLNLYEDGQVKDTFLQALADAKETVEKYPLADELAEAEAALREAMEALDGVRIDKIDLTKLQSVVNMAKPMYENLDKYIDNTGKDVFGTAYQLALELLAEPTTQEEVDQAAVALHNAMLDLRLKPNKDALLELVKKAESIDLDLYTQESAQVVRETLAAAKAVLEDTQATQEQVDNAKNTLQAALDNLDKKPDNPQGSTATGDSFPYWALSLTGAALLTVFILVRKRRAC